MSQIGLEGSNIVPSPCVRVCKFDDATALCLGCQRSRDEVRNWFKLTIEEKVTVLTELPDRARRRKELRDIARSSVAKSG